MNNSHIKKAYQYSSISTKIKLTIDALRVKNLTLSTNLWSEISAALFEMCNSYGTTNPEECKKLWEAAETVSSNCVGMSDAAFQGLLESVLLPELYNFYLIFDYCNDFFGSWSIMPSLSGFMTMSDSNNAFLHGTVDPLYDAYILANTLYSGEISHFHIWGGGLGYLAFALSDVSENSLEVYVYEYDQHRIEACEKYGILSLCHENVHIIRNKDPFALMKTFLEALDNESISTPSNYYINPLECNYLPIELASIARDFSANAMTFQNVKMLNKRNAYLNLRNIQFFLPKEGSEKDYIIVAGGPSVDSNIEYIRKMKGIKTIVAVSTIYQKLVRSSIQPDYVCVLDPNKRTFGHIKNEPNQNSVLIAGLEASWLFGANWKGEKYLFPICSTRYSFDIVKDNHLEAIDSRSTVSSMAIDVCAYLGAKKVELIGLDLSYPQNRSHASGTMDFHIATEAQNQYIKVESVTGVQVDTTPQFLAYARSIEKQIQNYKDISFINLSNCGINLSGCINAKHELGQTQ